MSDIEIEIDGKPLKAKPNSTIIQVADEAGIYIPRFCYHKHLSVAANCRMCLVDVEKAPKPAPACATPVMPGMKVFTRSPKALAAQRAVMEFLLINHPLDCPICDQGGECELQDLSMGYGASDSQYTFTKRSVKDEDLGPLIASDMTRCIQCTRCVRFGDEIAGLRELGAIGRGESMEIGTYVKHAIHSEVSGNVIDLCPVGALTSKPFRFTARAWELIQLPSIAPHDCLGSHVNVHVRYGKVMRVVPRENNTINQAWISDRDRYSYQGIYPPDRLAKPMIRVHNEWQETDWQTALAFAADRLQAVAAQHGADHIGALASPSATLEEFYLLQKLMRRLGSQHVDHRLRQVDFSDQDTMPMVLESGIKIADIENYDTILLVGSHLSKEQPILGLRVRKAALKGAKVVAINMVDYRFHFTLAARKIVAPHELVAALARIAKVIAPDSCAPLEVAVTEEDRALAETLRAGKKLAILVGALALNHPEAAAIRTLVRVIATACSGQLVLLTEGANAAGAWLAGAVPHSTLHAGLAVADGASPLDVTASHGVSSSGVAASHNALPAGLNASAMLQSPRKAYLLLNVEPELDCANPVAAMAALKQAECVVALSVYKNPSLERFAHVILPIATFTETSGTFVNVEGTWQGFQGAATPFEEARPAWKVLRVLSNFLHLDGFEYESSDAVTQEVKALLASAASSCAEANASRCQYAPNLSAIKLSPRASRLSRIGEIPLYAVDSLVRHAEALQATQAIVEGDLATARLHPQTAAALQIKESDLITFAQGENEVRLPAVVDERIPPEAVFIAGGIVAASGFSELFGDIEVRR